MRVDRFDSFINDDGDNTNQNAKNENGLSGFSAADGQVVTGIDEVGVEVFL